MQVRQLQQMPYPPAAEIRNMVPKAIALGMPDVVHQLEALYTEAEATAAAELLRAASDGSGIGYDQAVHHAQGFPALQNKLQVGTKTFVLWWAHSHMLCTKVLNHSMWPVLSCRLQLPCLCSDDIHCFRSWNVQASVGRTLSTQAWPKQPISLV
jgi:hypothetical protein